MDDKAIRDAIHASVAKSILATMDQEACNALLEKSIASALQSYDLRAAVQAVVAEKAVQVVSELMQSDEWDLRITEAMQAGFELYISELHRAIPQLMIESFHGKLDGSYGTRAGQILSKFTPKS